MKTDGEWREGEQSDSVAEMVSVRPGKKRKEKNKKKNITNNF